MEIFLPVLDTLISELTKRAEAYSLIGNLCSFLGELKTISFDELNKKCEHLANVYHKDLDDYADLLNDSSTMWFLMKIETLSTLYRKIILDNLKSVSQC